MENNKEVPYIVFEGEMNRIERMNKRLWILIIIMSVILVGSNGAWIYYENQFEDTITTETYEVESTEGGNAIVNGDGEIHINE